MLEILLYVLFIAIFFAMIATLYIFILQNISNLIINTDFEEGLRLFSSFSVFSLELQERPDKIHLSWKTII